MIDTAYLSALLALAAAFLFALSAHLQSVGLETGSTGAGTLLTIATTTGVYWLFAPFVLEASWWLTGATVLFALTGLFRPALSINLWVRGIKLLGPTLNAGLSATGPLFAAGFAILLLGEHLTVATALGTIAVVGGVAVTYLRPTGVARGWPAWAIALPLGAAFLRAAAHSITKLGYDYVASPYFAGLVAGSVSLVLVSLTYRAQGLPLRTPPRVARWFVLAGLVNAVAVYALNMALQLGQLVTVAPIVAISPVFAMLLGLLVFRREVITWRTAATIALVVPGVILVVTNG